MNAPESVRWLHDVCGGDTYHKAYNVAVFINNMTNQLEQANKQLAEARAEVDNIKQVEFPRRAEKLRAEARQEAAREIIQYIEDQGMIDAGTSPSNQYLVYEIDPSDIIELKKRFGLEG